MIAEKILSWLKLNTVARAAEDVQRRLSRAGVANAAWEAQELLASVLLCPHGMVSLRAEDALLPAQRERLESLVVERCLRRPLAYVLGEWDFTDLRLEITPDVLTPRPETEELFELAASFLAGLPVSGGLSLADVGTGSGCLALALARRFPEATVRAVDISPRALEVARRNADRHGVAGRVRFAFGDLLAPLLADPAARGFDAVVANLPYVDGRLMETLPPEVRFEPELALDGGRDGLEPVRRLLPQAFSVLRPGGRLFLEVGHDQARAVSADLLDEGFRDVGIFKDMAGIERFVTGKR